jgi:aminomethyltransferase
LFIEPIRLNIIFIFVGPKSRRRLEQGFVGASSFLEKDGKLKPVTKKRVGIAGMSAPAREHTEVFTLDGAKKIGNLSLSFFLNLSINAFISNLMWYFNLFYIF